MYALALEINVAGSVFNHIWMYSTVQQLQSPDKRSGGFKKEKNQFIKKNMCSFLLNEYHYSDTVMRGFFW